ncbi:MAG: RnfABCDGE type electron transport complex subunit B [Gammaproteobacteria bacterium]|nr:RnfABCDGE type electron transport complex subunit B [Gammaproteobacteria bacterium]
MNTLIIAPGIMAGLGLFFGAILAIAYRFLRVASDPRVEQVDDLLPGSNCGACGEPGCAGFAEKIVTGELQPSGCTVASSEVVEAIADFLGVDAGRQEKKVARLHCAGGAGQAHQVAEYQGFDSCRAASIISGGGKGCSFGCLGLADCRQACTFDAIHMNNDHLPVVDIDKCTACGDCVGACPRDLFEILPLSHNLLVQCKSILAGEDARVLCAVACDACGRCAADAPGKLIRMEDNLPQVDYSGGGPATPEITFRCPTNAIQWLEGQQFSQQPQAQSEERYA